MSVITYVNGQYVEAGSAQIPVDERGHQFGDGVYEVVRVYGGRMFLLDWHLERLERSLKAVGIENPHTRAEWTELLNEAVRRSGEAEATVYWQVTRGIAPRLHYFPQVAPSVTLTVRPVSGNHTDSASLICLPDERFANVWVKTINLLPNVIAKEVSKRAGAGEALLFRNGKITEGGGSNAWFVKGDTLYTHPANRYILGGITRRFVLELAKDAGIQVVESALTLDTLASVDEVFMSGTTIEILPVHQISLDPAIRASLLQLPEDTPDALVPAYNATDVVWTGSTPGPVTKRLQERFSRTVEQFRNYAEPLLHS